MEATDRQPLYGCSVAGAPSDLLSGCAEQNPRCSVASKVLARLYIVWPLPATTNLVLDGVSGMQGLYDALSVCTSREFRISMGCSYRRH